MPSSPPVRLNVAREIVEDGLPTGLLLLNRMSGFAVERDSHLRAANPIMLAFLIESIVLSVGGGAVGVGLASILQFFTISTLNLGSFSELAFSFALSPQIIAQSLSFSLLMGLLGGFLPSVRAARLNIIQALRAV